jgi:hypothetical protein
MKEAYSEQLLSQVLEDTGLQDRRRITVIDPYCGSGTTGVSLALRDHNGGTGTFLGVEANPFLHLAARAKINAIQKPPQQFERTAGRAAAEALRRRAPKSSIPKLSTFHHPDYFPADHLAELLRLRAAIEATTQERHDTCTADLLMLCLARAVEPSSFLRRDGRALRYEPGKQLRRPIDEFLRSVEEVAEDLDQNLAAGFSGKVVHADARRWDAFSDMNKADIALFSPPYPNNIDYTEVYKLEAWLLGLIESQTAFADQRRRTVRSHPSLKFEESYAFLSTSAATEIECLLAPILDAVPPDRRYAEARRRVIRGYADDIFVTLRHLRKRLKHHAFLVYVVGNSVHGSDGGSLVIAADLVIARLAELAGFEIERVEIARRPMRRNSSSPFVRESVVFARVRSPVRRQSTRKRADRDG